MNNYVLLHQHSDASLMDGFSKPKDIVKRAKELGMEAIAITDHGTCSNHVAFYSECKKNNIKSILGIELYCAFEPAALKLNRDHTHMVCFAKNQQGVKDIWKMSSYSNNPEIFYYKPRLNIENWKHPETNEIFYGIEEFAKNGNIYFISGHHGSFLSDVLFADLFGDPQKRKEQIKKAYAQSKISDQSYYDSLRKSNWLESSCELALRLEKMAGKGNFWIELQNELDPHDRLPLWIHPTIVDSLREVSKQTGIPAICTGDAHYVRKEDAEDQRLMLKINMKETDDSIKEALDNSDENDIFVFYGSNNFYIHAYEEMAAKFTAEEIENTLKIARSIEDYDIIKSPKIPKFQPPSFDQDAYYLNDCPTDSDKFLMHIVVQGAKKLKPWESNNGFTKQNYWDRVLSETRIIFKAGLSDYLLIVWDLLSFCDYNPSDGTFDWVKNLEKHGKIDPIVRGSGRGSVGGSLTCYFLGIHRADSLKYKLSFGRFFNEARMNEMMDIDSDIENAQRDRVVDYLVWKYGEDKVGQIATFGRMQGKSSIKDIIRVKGIPNGVEIGKLITENIPDESKIIDEIQEVRDTGEEYGIVSWALDHSESIQEYYKDPQYKEIFDQAIRVEGTKRNMSRHASGFIISSDPISECAPMVLDTKTKKKIVGFDMNNVSKVSLVKLDLLGLTLLDRLKKCQNLVNEK